MITDFLRKEHRNIERLLFVLERELTVFDSGARPDYEVISAVIGYFQFYPEAYHHPQEDLVFQKLKERDPDAAAHVDLAAEHRKVGQRLRRVAQAVDSVLMDQEVSRDAVDAIIHDFIEQERRHIAMEESDFFPAAEKVLQTQDWEEIAASRRTNREDPLFSETVEERFDALRTHILQLEQQAEAERA